MFDYIKNEELKTILINIKNQDNNVENIASSVKLIKLLNEITTQEIQEQLVDDLLSDDKIIKYFRVWVKDSNISIIKENSEVSKIVKMLITKSDDIRIKTAMFEILSKLKFEHSIYIAMDMKEEKIQEAFFERLFIAINNDNSFEKLNRFVIILKRKPNDFKEGIIFDFIDMLSNINLNKENYKIIDDLRATLGTTDELIRKEIIKLKYDKFKLSHEFEFINGIISDEITHLGYVDINLLALSINSKSISDIITVLEYLKDIDIYEELINIFIGSNEINLDKEKIIKVLAGKKLYVNEIQQSFVYDYIKQNKIQMNNFEREYCEEDYISKKISLITNHSKNNEMDKIKNILRNEDNKEILKEISIKSIENMLQNNKFNILIELWDEFKLPITSKLQYGEKLKDLIITSHEISEEMIQFLIDMDLDDISLYQNIKDDSSRTRLLNNWRKNNKSGKVVDAIKYKIDLESQTIEDLKTINKMIELYNINDNRLETYLKLKVYSKIELELLDIDPMDSKDALKLDNIIDLVIEYNLESRLLNDKYILDILDKEIKDSIAKKIINKSQSEDVLNAFWDRVDEAIRMGRKQNISENVKIILPYITESSTKIDWFLELLEGKKYKHSIIEIIIEICLEDMGRNKNIINQLKKDLEDSKPTITLYIAKNLVTSLARLEQSIINIKDEKQKNILISNIRSLRKSLSNVGIDTVEDVLSYNNQVELDEEKHTIKGNVLDDKGLVETLGVKVNDIVIAKSMLGDIGEVDVIE